MTKRFIPVLAACLFLMVGTAQAATSLAFPPPDTKGGKPLMQTLSGRATNRSFTAKPLSDKLLGDLLWAAYGVNRPNGKRTIPTAQNRQDLEIYVLRSDGAWLYDAPKHSLEQVSSSDLRNFLAGISLLGCCVAIVIYRKGRALRSGQVEVEAGNEAQVTA